MTKSRGILAPRRMWLPWELELLSSNYAESLNSDLATVLDRPIHIVAQKANNLGLKKTGAFIAAVASERTRRRIEAGTFVGFPKGHVPANKGEKRPPGWSPGRMATTQFKKGHAPPTTLPVGSLRVSGDGYLEVKYSERPGPPKMRWKAVHRAVWEDAHGPIPAGHIVTFRPGCKTTDPDRIRVEALELITLAENLARNSIHNLPPELVKVVQLRGALNRQINRLTKDTP